MKRSLATLRKIEKCAITLVDKLKVVHADPLYETVWHSAANHGIDYSKGPKYEIELRELRRALGKPA